MSHYIGTKVAMLLSLAAGAAACGQAQPGASGQGVSRAKLIVNGVTFTNTENASALGKAAAANVAALVDSATVSTSTNPATLSTRASDFCTGEPFATEKRVFADSECSAFFIGGDKFLTAGHCVLPPGVSAPDQSLEYLDCASGAVAVVMGWTTDTSNPTGNPAVAPDQLYNCTSVVSHGGVLPPQLHRPTCGPGKPAWPACSREDARFDWAVIQVERPVTASASGLPIASPYELKAAQPATVVGYPGGLPQKIDEAAALRTTKPLDLFSWFEFDADIARGNSGGPVIDSATNVALGIVSAFPDGNDSLDPLSGACRTHSTCNSGSGVCAHGSQAATAWNAFFPPFPDDSGPRPAAIDFETGMSFAILGDWNINGVNDAMVFTRQSNGILVALIIDSVAYPLGVVPDTSARMPLVASGDFTGDGLSDLALVADGAPYFFSSTDVLGFFLSPDATRAFAPASNLDFLAQNYSMLVADDINGDLTQDVRAFSASGEQTVFCGGPQGLSTTCSGAGVRIDLEGDGDLDVVQLFLDTDGQVHWRTRLSPSGSVTNNTYAPYQEPIMAVAGNFNGDTNGSTGLPQMELAFLSGKKPYYLLSMGTSGTGGMVARPLDGRADYIALRVTDVDGDGNDDIEAVRADRSVRVFMGRTGVADSGGPSTQGIDFAGMPNADSGDGRFLVTSGGRGTNLDHLSLLVQLPADASKANLQVFDGDFGGLYDDFDAAQRVACYALHTAPDGTPPDNPTAGALLKFTGSDFRDGAWSTILNQTPHSQARLAAGQPYFYRLEVYFSSTAACDDVVGEVDATNSFKVRSNGAVIWDTGDIEIMPRDLLGKFGGGSFASSVDTDYDGTWDVMIDVGDAVSGEIRLLDRDADRADATIPGSPPQPNLFYTLTPTDPAADFIFTVESPLGPSGSFPDEETLTFDTHGIADPTRSFGGLWLWRWENLHAGNDVHLGVRASPPRYAATGASIRRLSPSAARDAATWNADTSSLLAGLPVVLGRGSGTLTVTTTAAATGIFSHANGTGIEQLRAELLAAKLNMGRARAIGENLAEAHFYGSEVLVKDQIAASDELLRIASTAGEPALLAAARLLRAGNRGGVSYVPVEIAPSADPSGDPDADGIDDVHDNCPVVANATQADRDRNGIGDACDPAPVAECVLPQAAGGFTAVFGYVNPFRERSLPTGVSNSITGAASGATPPTFFRRGDHTHAFAVDSAATSVSWNILGNVATLSLASPRCSGSDLIALGFGDDVVLYGAAELRIADRASVTDCSTAESRGSVDIGADTHVGEILTTGNVALHDRANVCGPVLANGTATVGNGVVTGGILQQQSNSVPRLDWAITFPTSTGDILVAPDASVTLAPGSYGQVAVNSRATLTLTAGTYYFDRLTIESQGKIVANEASGSVTIYVHQNLIWHGDVVQTGGNGLLMGYFGSFDAVIERPFAGTLIAPLARITLASVATPGYVGRFFANRLEVRPDVVVRR